MIFVGNKQVFAIECVPSPTDTCEGYIYIYVRNQKFGSERGEFNLDQFFHLVETSLKSYEPVVPELVDLTAAEILQSLDSVWLDTNVEDCPIEGRIEGFFDEPSTVLDVICFYGGGYAFDDNTIVVVADEKRMAHIIVRNENSKVFSQARINLDEFKLMFLDLRSAWKNSQD